jgi:DNA-binding LytR/AlgR family response regulator
MNCGSSYPPIQLRRLLPAMLIVFTTAYDEYAGPALALRAVDFLLKPFAQHRLAQTVERIRHIPWEQR